MSKNRKVKDNLRVNTSINNLPAVDALFEKIYHATHLCKELKINHLELIRAINLVRQLEDAITLLISTPYPTHNNHLNSRAYYKEIYAKAENIHHNLNKQKLKTPELKDEAIQKVIHVIEEITLATTALLSAACPHKLDASEDK